MWKCYKDLTQSLKMLVGLASVVGIGSMLRAEQSGDRKPMGDEIFRARPDRPWGPPNLL